MIFATDFNQTSTCFGHMILNARDILCWDGNWWFKAVCLVGKRCNQSLTLFFCCSHLLGILLQLIYDFPLLQQQNFSICHLVNFQSSWTLLLITFISNSVSRFHFSVASSNLWHVVYLIYLSTWNAQW